MKESIEMKFKGNLVLAAFMATLAIGRAADQSAQTNTDKKVTGADVGQSYQNAAGATKDYAVQTKDQFVAAAGKRMKDFDTKIDALAKKSAGYKDDAKVQADKALALLRKQRDEAAKKFEAVKKSSQGTWEKTRAGFESAWGNVEKAYDKVKSKFD